MLDSPPVDDPAQPYWFLYGDYARAVETHPNLSPHSRKLYLATPRTFGRWAEAEAGSLGLILPLDPAALTRRHCETWQAAQLRRAKPASVAVWHVVLGRWFGWLVTQHEIPVSPLGGVPVPAGKHAPPPTLTPAEIRALLATCGDRATFADRRDAAILYVLVDCGLRKQELLDLKLTDVNFKEGFLHVTRGKGGKGRDVGLGDAALSALRAYVRTRAKWAGAESDWLWLSTRHASGAGARFSRNTLGAMLSRRAAAAGLERAVWPHLFRHTFVDLYLSQDGAQEGDVIAEAGWSERTARAMLDRYGAANRSKRAVKAHKRFAPGDQL